LLTPEEIIKGLKPCHYKYNDKLHLGDKVNYGFLAQDILEEFGEDYNFVLKDADTEYFKVNYTQFISPLVAVVQAQQKEIAYLKSELEKLKEKDIV
jgi:hypothetical protein